MLTPSDAFVVRSRQDLSKATVFAECAWLVGEKNGSEIHPRGCVIYFLLPGNILVCRLVQAQNPEFLQSPTSTPFLRDRPWFFHVFNVPLPSLFINGFFFFFFFSPDIWVFLGLKGSHLSCEKTNIRNRLDRDTLNTCAKFQGLSLKNGVDIWTFVRSSAKITAYRNYLVLLNIRIWASILTQYWSYAVSSSNIGAKLCTNMPWNTWKRLVQKKMGRFFFFLR